MTGASSVPTTGTSALGCKLRDWNFGSRECAGVARTGRRRGLIVDLDDTLYPHEHWVQSGLMAVARHLEDAHRITAMDAFATMSAARREGERGRELQAVCARYALSPDMVPTLLNVYREHRPLLRLPRASAVALSTLRLAEWRLVILTNGLPAIQRAKVAALGLQPLVDSVVYAEEHAEGGKPSPAAFREALRRLGVQARQCVCAGDDPARDVAGARRLGIRTIRIATAAAHVEPGADADAVIESIDKLPAVASYLLDAVTTDAA
jgi:putative hydrolase of the HAD superfamily